MSEEPRTELIEAVARCRSVASTTASGMRWRQRPALGCCHLATFLPKLQKGRIPLLHRTVERTLTDMATYLDGNVRKATANTVTAMERSAARRQCPLCGRKSALVYDPETGTSSCRWSAELKRDRRGVPVRADDGRHIAMCPQYPAHARVPVPEPSEGER